MEIPNKELDHGEFICGPPLSPAEPYRGPLHLDLVAVLLWCLIYLDLRDPMS